MKIAEMSDQHLVNRIAWAKRVAPPDPWEVHGDERKYGAGGFMAAVLEKEHEKWSKHIDDMEQELSRRKSTKETIWIK